MMSSKLKYSLLSGTFLVSIAAQAEVTMTLPVICVDAATLTEVLEEYNEKPMLTMNTVRDVGGQAVAVPTVLFVNQQTKTWTLVEKIDDSMYCAISAGENFSYYRAKSI